MMMRKIEAALAAERGIADWKIVETRRRGSELYLVGGLTDMARGVEALEYRLVVYVDADVGGQKVRGDASVTIHPTMAAAELAATVGRAAFAASRSRNPWYPLPEPAPALTTLPASDFAARESAAWMGELRDAFLGHEAVPGSRINSLELFLSRNETRIQSSRGIDQSFVQHSGYAEYTVEAKGRDGDVELTDDLRFSEPDLARLSGVIGSRLRMVHDRAEASPTPALSGLPLVLTGNEAAEALGWFFINSGSERAYTKASPFVLGESVHGEGARAGEYDPLELRAEAALPGHPRSAPFDLDGVPLAPRPCIEGGVLRTLVGPARYASYLGLPLTGDFGLFSVGPGGATLAELRSAPHLEAAFFSDFSVDPDSGDFGGEIRLAYHFDGKRRVPVHGGSVTGSLFENRGALRLSRELELSGPMRGPAAILLPSVSVTGAG